MRLYDSNKILLAYSFSYTLAAIYKTDTINNANNRNIQHIFLERRKKMQRPNI